MKKSRDQSSRFEDHAGPKDSFVKFAKKTSEGSCGMPVGIQVACLPYCDEQLVGISKQIQKVLPFEHVPLAKVNHAK